MIIVLHKGRPIMVSQLILPSNGQNWWCAALEKCTLPALYSSEYQLHEHLSVLELGCILEVSEEISDAKRYMIRIDAKTITELNDKDYLLFFPTTEEQANLATAYVETEDGSVPCFVKVLPQKLWDDAIQNKKIVPYEEDGQ